MHLTEGEAEIVSPQVDQIIHHLSIIQDSAVRKNLKLIPSQPSNGVVNFIFDRIEQGSSLSVIVGSPGCGKTVSMAYAFLSYAAILDPDELAIWVPVNRSGYYIFQAGRIRHVCTELNFPAETYLVVFDGFNPINSRLWCDKLLAAYRDLKEISPFIFIVSSFQAVLLDNPKLKRTFSDAEEHHMPSWTLDDYLLAMEDEVFFDEIKDIFPQTKTSDWINSIENRQKCIEDKYPLAGTCARWMFDFSELMIQESVQSWFQRIPNFDSFYFTGIMFNPALSTLFTLINPNTPEQKIVPVSDYITRVLPRLIHSDTLNEFLRSAYFHTSHFNPAFDGWILELDFITAIIQNNFSQRVKTIGKSDYDQSFVVFDYTYFHSIKNFEVSVFPFNNWYIPERVNQGSFDAVQLLPYNKLRFVQIPRAIRQTINVHYMHAFLVRFNELRHSAGLLLPIVDFEIVTIVPTTSISEYKASEIVDWPSGNEITNPMKGEPNLPLSCNQETAFKVASFRRTGQPGRP